MIKGEVNGVEVRIFDSLDEALKAGCFIDTPIPDEAGFLHARFHNGTEWTPAIVRMRRFAEAKP